MNIAAGKLRGSVPGPIGRILISAILALCCVLIACGGNAGSTSATTPANPQPAPSTPAPNNTVQHVVIVVEENKNYNQVVGSADMPFLNSLIAQGALATNYYANGVDSLPNYFMMTVGKTETTGATFNSTVTDDNIVRELIAAGKTWKAYAEAIPSVGYLGPDQPPYVKVHNPFAYFSDVVNSAAQARNIVGIDQFAADLAAGALPNYSMVIPDNQNNGHDCPAGMTTCTTAEVLANSDAWLKSHLQPLMNSSAWKNTVFIVTYDESEGDTTNGGGRVMMVITGPKVIPGFKITTFMQHESTLRLSMKALGLGTFPGLAATAPDMDSAFNATLP